MTEEPDPYEALKAALESMMKSLDDLKKEFAVPKEVPEDMFKINEN